MYSTHTRGSGRKNNSKTSRRGTSGDSARPPETLQAVEQIASVTGSAKSHS